MLLEWGLMRQIRSTHRYSRGSLILPSSIPQQINQRPGWIPAFLHRQFTVRRTKTTDRQRAQRSPPPRSAAALATPIKLIRGSPSACLGAVRSSTVQPPGSAPKPGSSSRQDSDRSRGTFRPPLCSQCASRPAPRRSATVGAQGSPLRLVGTRLRRGGLTPARHGRHQNRVAATKRPGQNRREPALFDLTRET